MRKKLFGALLAAVFVAVTALQGTASAAAPNYNNIIDVNVFDNYSSMDAAAIDSFLNKFPNSCISTNNGFSTPDAIGYNPSSKFQYGGLVSAGTAISHIAQAYTINPQVLLATLQKEQGLVVGDGGNVVRGGQGNKDCGALAISAAVGYACPDSMQLSSYSGFTMYGFNGTPVTSVTNTCVRNAAYVGFTRQVVNAAWLFTFDRHRSEGEADWYVDKPNWDNSDDANFCYSGPMTEGTYRTCPSGVTAYRDGKITIDGTSVHIDNGATAALYHYTPHKHGQDLFYDRFTSWFGSTYGVYKWNTDTYQVWTKDEATRLDPGQLQPGEKYMVKVYATNTGNAIWKKGVTNPVLMGTTNPQGHSSFLCDSSWLSCSRPGSFSEASVSPGEGGNFKFVIQAPYQPGNYREFFKPVAEMLAWSNDIGESLGIRVVSPGSYSWQNDGYKLMDNTKAQYVDPGRLTPGETYTAILAAKNTGSATWKNTGATPINLGTTNGDGRNSSLCTGSWIACNRPAKLQEATVAPGATGHFEFIFKAPYQPGNYREFFKPVAEMSTWMNPTDEPLGVTVASPGSYKWWTGGYQIFNEADTARVDPGQLQQNTKYIVKLNAYNTGSATWYKDGNTPVLLGKVNGNSLLCIQSLWPACNRPVGLTEASVAPGQMGEFKFFIQTSSAGTYREDFKPVAEMLAWTNDIQQQTLGIIVR